MDKSDRKTLFVLGAGASKEVRLPIGAELTELISSALDLRWERNSSTLTRGSDEIYDAIRYHARTSSNFNCDVNEYIQACRQISSGMPQAISIDNYIHQHRDNPLIEFCGKLAIAHTILSAERASDLYLDPSKPGRKLERLADVAIVIFNYDRCFEQFLVESITNSYNLPFSEAVDIISQLSIYHPYGSVGTLPWWDGEKNSVPFGANLHAAKLIEITDDLKTFTEGVDASSSHIAAVREAARNANRTIFLGFAYHHLNMGLLYNGDIDGASKTVFGTAFQTSKSNRDIITSLLEKLTGTKAERIYINDLCCSDLYKEYRLSFSFV